LKKEDDYLYKLIDSLGSFKKAKVMSEQNYKFNIQIPFRFMLKHNTNV
jgi:hypothetical protein